MILYKGYLIYEDVILIERLCIFDVYWSFLNFCEVIGSCCESYFGEIKIGRLILVKVN